MFCFFISVSSCFLFRFCFYGKKRGKKKKRGFDPFTSARGGDDVCLRIKRNDNNKRLGKKLGLRIDGDQVCLQPLPQSALCPPHPAAPSSCSSHGSVSLQLSIALLCPQSGKCFEYMPMITGSLRFNKVKPRTKAKPATF